MPSDSEGWRSNADTHKLRQEDAKNLGVDSSKRPPGQHPGGVLHQRRSMPFSTATMAAAGLAIVGAIGYLTLYYKAKPGTTPEDVAKAAVGGEEGRGIKTAGGGEDGRGVKK